jgi:flagellar motor switch protein FliN/FliY
MSDDQDKNAKEDDPWADALAEQEQGEQGAETATEEAKPEAEAASMEPLEADAQADNANISDLDVILDIPVNISMEIGSTEISIRNLLQLNQGSVIELDRFAGEPLDVLVNGTLIAHGEVVVVNDKFGIRLTDVISPYERIKKIN